MKSGGRQTLLPFIFLQQAPALRILSNQWRTGRRWAEDRRRSFGSHPGSSAWNTSDDYDYSGKILRKDTHSQSTKMTIASEISSCGWVVGVERAQNWTLSRFLRIAQAPPPPKEKKKISYRHHPVGLLRNFITQLFPRYSIDRSLQFREIPVRPPPQKKQKN